MRPSVRSVSASSWGGCIPGVLAGGGDKKHAAASVAYVQTGCRTPLSFDGTVASNAPPLARDHTSPFPTLSQYTQTILLLSATILAPSPPYTPGLTGTVSPCPSSHSPLGRPRQSASVVLLDSVTQEQISPARARR